MVVDALLALPPRMSGQHRQIILLLKAYHATLRLQGAPDIAQPME